MQGIKRIFGFFIFFVILYLTYQFVVMLFIEKHQTTYQLEENDKVFSIQENYTVDNKKHDYYFEIKVDDHEFAFHNMSNLNKKKQVIEKIEYFESGDWFCIYPILTTGKTNNQTEIVCNRNQQLYTYTYLNQQDNKVVNLFVKKLQNLEYKNDSWNTNNKKEEFGNLTVYPDNIKENYYITIWNYRGLTIINQDNKLSYPLLRQDQYENTHGRLIRKYYCIPNYDQPYDFTEWKVLDILSLDEDVITMKGEISFDSYINGIVKNELYIFDKSNKKQYAINPTTLGVREVGNIEIDGQYYQDNKWETRNIYEFLDQEVIFDEKQEIDAISKKYGKVEIKKSNNIYYFKTEDGKVYMTFADHFDKSVLLFENKDILEWKIVDNVIYFLSDTTIYQYDESTGLKPIILNNEFKYNYKNIFDVYKK